MEEMELKLFQTLVELTLGLGAARKISVTFFKL